MKWIRCPVCGKKARPKAIGNAGQHLLGVLTLKGLGKGKGFTHIWSKMPLELLRALKIALQKALNQVISEIEALEYISTLPGEEKPLKVKIKGVYYGQEERIFIGRGETERIHTAIIERDYGRGEAIKVRTRDM